MLSIGAMASNVSEAIAIINNQDAIAHYDLRFVKPLDEKLLHNIFIKFVVIVTVEDGVKSGGFGSAILEFAAQNNYSQKIDIIGISDTFPEHGKVEQLQESTGISPKQIIKVLEKYL